MKPHVCKTWVYFGYVWRSFNIEAIARGDTSRIRIHNNAYCTLNFVRIHVPLHTSSDTDAVLKASGKLLAAISPVHGSTIAEKFCRHFAQLRFHKAVSKYITSCIQLNSVQIKWSSGRPDAQNCRRTTWTSQQVIRGTTRLTSPELEFDFENLFHLFWSASSFKIDGFQH